MEIAIGFLCLSLIVCTFIIFNLLNKLEKIDDELVDLSKTVEQIILDFNDAKRALDEIDSKGTFKSDDEIGTVFNAVNQIVSDLNTKYIEEDINE